MKKILLLTFLIKSVLFSDTLELADISGITYKELIDTETIVYNQETNELSKYCYFLKDGQLYKHKSFTTIYPSNKIPNSHRIIHYKKELEKLGCKNYKAKECINSFLPTKAYLEDEYGKKTYILDKEKSKIYDIIKFNY